MLAPVVRDKKGDFADVLGKLRQDGFVRANIDGDLYELAEPPTLAKNTAHTIEVFVDRLVKKDGIRQRLTDSIELAAKLTEGVVKISPLEGEDLLFSEKFACTTCGISYPEITPRLFSFNNPAGACPSCDGIGAKMFFDPDLIVPDEELSIKEGAIEPWERRNNVFFHQILDAVCTRFEIDQYTPWNKLPQKSRALLFNGVEGEEVELGADGVEDLMEEDVVPPLPGLDGALFDRQLLVGDDEVGVEEHLGADAVARRTGAGRVVEREEPRRDLRIADPAGGTGELFGEEEILPLERRDLHDALGELGRQLDGIGEPLPDAVLLHQPVDEHLDGVRGVLGQRRRLGQLVEVAVDVGAHEAVLPQLAEHVGEVPLLVAHDRRQHREALPLGELQHPIDHLLNRLRGDRLTAVPAVDRPDARPEQPQVVVDLRRRSHGRARVARAGLLLDGDRRRQPLDRVDVGLVHLVEELARVGRQRLDVAALPLGVERVERQRRLPRTRQPRDHHQLVARDLDVDVLEVVLARALDLDAVGLLHAAGANPGGSASSEAGRATRADFDRLYPITGGKPQRGLSSAADDGSR